MERTVFLYPTVPQWYKAKCIYVIFVTSGMQIGLKPHTEVSSAAQRSAKDSCASCRDSAADRGELRQGEERHCQSHQDSNRVPNFCCWEDKTASGLFGNAVLSLLWTEGNSKCTGVRPSGTRQSCGIPYATWHRGEKTPPDVVEEMDEIRWIKLIEHNW